MKRVEVIIRHFKLDEVTAALYATGIQGMTVTEVRGFGRQGGRNEVYRGSDYTGTFIPKVKLDIFVTEHQLPAIMNAILQSARTGEVGDGKIFVTSLDEMVRIRTGEVGAFAL